jgi:hypothetical protein
MIISFAMSLHHVPRVSRYPSIVRLSFQRTRWMLNGLESLNS